MNLFAVGSRTARAICRDAGIDPDGTDRRPMETSKIDFGPGEITGVTSYERLKRLWQERCSDATPAEYEQAMRVFARLTGV